MRPGLKPLGYCLLTAFAISAGGLVSAAVITWSAGLPFGPTGNYISELSVGPGGSPAAFVIMIVGLAVFSGAFFVLAPGPLQRAFGHTAATARIGRIFGIAGTAALLAMVFFPLDPTRPSVFMTHIALAITAFVSTSGEMAAYARTLSRGTGVLRSARITALLAAPFTFLFAVLVLLVEVLGVAQASPAIFVIEWLAFAFFAAWIFLTGLGLLREAVNRGSGE